MLNLALDVYLRQVSVGQRTVLGVHPGGAGCWVVTLLVPESKYPNLSLSSSS